MKGGWPGPILSFIEKSNIRRIETQWKFWKNQERTQFYRKIQHKKDWNRDSAGAAKTMAGFIEKSNIRRIETYILLIDK